MTGHDVGEAIKNGTRTVVSADAIVHGLIVLAIVICATLLTLHHALASGDALAVYTGAIGYAAGRSGTRAAARTSDVVNPPH